MIAQWSRRAVTREAVVEDQLVRCGAEEHIGGRVTRGRGEIENILLV
jgi:hypothetical protein